MMSCRPLLLGLLVLAALPARAQEERSIDNFAGLGVRAMGMGGAYAGEAAGTLGRVAALGFGAGASFGVARPGRVPGNLPLQADKGRQRCCPAERPPRTLLARHSALDALCG